MSTITIERDCLVNDGAVEISGVTISDGGIDLVMNDVAYRITEMGQGRLCVCKEEGEPYLVNASGMVLNWTCSCPDYKYRCSKTDPAKRKVCKHILAAYHSPALAQ